MSCAALRVENRSSGRASSIGIPRTWSATRRALRGATRTKRARALTTGGRFGSSFFLVAAFFAAGFFASAFGFDSLFEAGFFAAGFLAGTFLVAVEAAFLSAVFEVAEAAEPLPFVAVSVSFFAAGFLVAGFFGVSFFSSAITLQPCRCRNVRGRFGSARTRRACG